MAEIRKLIKLQSDLNAFVKQIMEKHGVSVNYIRGLMKEPTGAAAQPARKKATKKAPIDKKTTKKETSATKKPVTKKSSSKTKKQKKTLDELLGF